MQTVEKVCFYKTRSKFSIPNPKPLPRGEGLCMLCWLCIVQSLLAYTPGIRAGAECGAAALTPLGATPKARMLWLLAKSFARCKTSRASNTKHPFSKIYRFINKLKSTARKQWISFISGFSKSPNSESVLSYCNRR